MIISWYWDTWMILRYMADIVIFGWYCEIWLKLWYFADIVKSGWTCDIWLILWYSADSGIFGWYCDNCLILCYSAIQSTLLRTDVTARVKIFEGIHTSPNTKKSPQSKYEEVAPVRIRLVWLTAGPVWVWTWNTAGNLSPGAAAAGIGVCVQGDKKKSGTGVCVQGDEKKSGTGVPPREKKNSASLGRLV